MSEPIIVAMSGGVDSSVAAALLQRQGFDVQGVFMKNWSPDDLQSLADCPWEQDQADAMAVCEHLGIPFRSINFEKEYKERVVDYFLGEYEAGRTPNPDVMCNKEIKFAAFLDAAERLGIGHIATGHYAQSYDGQLYRGADLKKDQSYFLYTLNQRQLAAARFPLGGLQKAEVRALAAEFGLPTAAKKDSQGICFIGHIDLKKFLMHQLGTKPGETCLLPPYEPGTNLLDRVERARKAGTHQGAMFYTVGERTGAVLDNLRYRLIRGNSDVPATYLVLSDVQSNRLYVTDDPQDPHLSCNEVYLDGYIPTGSEGADSIKSTVDALAKISNLSCQVRYQQKPVPVREISLWEDKICIKTSEPLRAVAAGQSLVLYENDRVRGGGVVWRTSHTIQSA